MAYFNKIPFHILINIHQIIGVLLGCCFVVLVFFFNTHRLFSEAVYPVVCVIYLKCTSAV